MEEHRARGTMSCGDLRLLVKSKRKRRAKNSELSSTPAPTRWRLRMWEIAKNKREKFSSSLWNAGSYVLGTNSRFISTVCAGKTFIWSFRERESLKQKSRDVFMRTRWGAETRKNLKINKSGEREQSFLNSKAFFLLLRATKHNFSLVFTLQIFFACLSSFFSFSFHISDLIQVHNWTTLCESLRKYPIPIPPINTQHTRTASVAVRRKKVFV